MKDLDKIVGNCKGWTIRLGHFHKKFYAERAGEEGRIDGDSYVAVTEAIDKHEALLRKTSRRKISLALIDDEGVAHTATGVNANTRGLNMTPKPERYGYHPRVFYVDLPWVRLLVARKKALEEMVEAVVEALSPAVAPRDASGYGRIESEDLMVKLIDEVKERYAKAAKAKPPANLDALLGKESSS